jgi:hypothetical protein
MNSTYALTFNAPMVNLPTFTSQGRMSAGSLLCLVACFLPLLALYIA